MNKKGATLIEMVVAILVISIASVILFAGFATVARVLGDANRIKNNSDTLLSYAEKTDDGALRSKVNRDEKPLSYNIVDDNGDTIQVMGNYSNINVIGNDEVYLKSIRNEKQILVKESEQYLNASAFAKRLNELCKKAFDKAEPGFPSNQNLKDVFIQYGYKWPEFPTGLLPAELQKKVALNNAKFFIKPCYPWDYEEQGAIDYKKGSLLIFLSLDSSEVNDRSDEDMVNLVYNYEDKDSKGTWYYFEGNRFGVSFGFPYPLYTTNFIVDSQKVEIGKADTPYSSWADLMTRIVAKGSGWKVLDISAAYTPESPDLFWKDI